MVTEGALLSKGVNCREAGVCCGVRYQATPRSEGAEGRGYRRCHWYSWLLVIWLKKAVCGVDSVAPGLVTEGVASVMEPKAR